jgi:hypothetical protein
MSSALNLLKRSVLIDEVNVHRASFAGKEVSDRDTAIGVVPQEEMGASESTCEDVGARFANAPPSGTKALL